MEHPPQLPLLACSCCLTASGPNERPKVHDIHHPCLSPALHQNPNRYSIDETSSIPGQFVFIRTLALHVQEEKEQSRHFSIQTVIDMQPPPLHCRTPIRKRIDMDGGFGPLATMRWPQHPYQMPTTSLPSFKDHRHAAQDVHGLPFRQNPACRNQIINPNADGVAHVIGLSAKGAVDRIDS